MIRVLAGFSLLGAVIAPTAASAEVGINVYGLSHHFDEARAERLGVDNEVNPGLGLRWREDKGSARVQWFADGGAYRDSGRNTAVYAGAGAFWKPAARLRIGGALAVFDSDTYNRGEAFLAPLPMLAWETRAATFNLVYFPKVSKLNDVAAVGLWITLWPRGIAR